MGGERTGRADIGDARRGDGAGDTSAAAAGDGGVAGGAGVGERAARVLGKYDVNVKPGTLRVSVTGAAAVGAGVAGSVGDGCDGGCAGVFGCGGGCGERVALHRQVRFIVAGGVDGAGRRIERRWSLNWWSGRRRRSRAGLSFCGAAGLPCVEM